ncbi:MAG: FHA domain-containing protein [Pyrinomonadaceae bacterium]
MTELYLEYKDEHGEIKRERVEGEKCAVGRHSASDICIPDGRLSRSHLKIDRFGDVFVVSDAGSSNGTILNGSMLRDPIALKNGDVLDLGGLKINVVFDSTAPEPKADPGAEFESEQPPTPETNNPESGAGAGNFVQTSGASGSGSMLIWILVPVFGLIFIMFAGVIIFLIASGPTTTIAKKQSDTTYTDDDFDSDNDKKPSNKSTPGSSNSGTTTASPGSNTSTSNDTPSGTNAIPTGNSEVAKIEQNGGAFLRRIAQNDQQAFLTTEQATKLSSKIKQFSGSSAIAENLKSASKNAAKLTSMAKANGLRPQFLTIAAVAKLGSSRGDVQQAADSMIQVLSKLAGSIGTERADESLIVIACYGQGTAGEFLKMRNMLQDLANKAPESARAIRSIWYLQKNGKITQAEFDNALNFLAIGVISQNPKEFGVNADAVAL